MRRNLRLQIADCRGRRTAAGWGLVLVMMWLMGYGLATAQAQDAGQFLTDVKALTVAPNRLSGTPQGRAAGDYILQRLKALGIRDVMTLDMPVFQTHTRLCTLTVGGQTVNLLPLRPDLVAPPATPPQGLTGPLLYVGKGELADYGRRNPHGAIVVMDYASADNWERAFTLGAQAVIFLGDPQAAPVYPKHTEVPANLVRLYASPAVQKQIDLKHDYPQATVVSAVDWVRGVGRNILAFLPGTAPTFAGRMSDGKPMPEMMVLGANYDSFGEVPDDSPGARGAGNIAALLEAVAHFQHHRPKRDLLVMFLDNQARYHEGARYIYDALNSSASDAAQLQTMHQRERDFLRAMRAQLQKLTPATPLTWETQARPWYVATAIGLIWLAVGTGLFMLGAWTVLRLKLAGVILVGVAGLAGAVVFFWWAFGGSANEAGNQPQVLVQLLAEMEKQAEIIRADLNQQVLAIRLQRTAAGAAQRPALQEQLKAIEARVQRWDQVRRVLHNGRIDQVDRGLFPELTRATAQRFDERLEELDLLLKIDGQRQALIARAGGDWNVLHVTYNLSGDGPSWSIVLGDWTERGYLGRSNTTGDSPGWYQRVLAAVREAAGTAGLTPADGFAAQSVADTSSGGRYVPGQYTNGGMVAGTYGIFDVALMTSFDGRLRDGQPSDTLANLSWQRLEQQAWSADKLLAALADSQSLSLSRQFQATAITKRPTWSDGRTSGDFAGLQVTGSLSEDRPAAGALMALIPTIGGSPASGNWDMLKNEEGFLGFDPVVMEPVDGNGRFATIGVRKNPLFGPVAGVGALFDAMGRVRAISTRETVQQFMAGSMLVNLFPAAGSEVVYQPLTKPLPGTLLILSSATDSPFPPARSLYGQLGPFNFFYTSTLLPPPPVKVFQPDGPVLLNGSPQRPHGTGLPASALAVPPAIDLYTARDLWQLNEDRLEKLRSRGVTDVDLEALHNRAQRALEAALAPATLQQPDGLEQRHADLLQSAALSRAVYTPLRQSMDDLVYAIVFLLLLAIPFAFALERLLFAATTIYRRLAGFAAAFLATFLLLYFLHPGFAIASTPIIIFLAFTILLLSGLVIYIIVRKFRTELKAIQGQGVGLHNLEVSKLGTLLAAVNMGMSTMRRRPTRTVLTAVTVVMLTFTILCFASVTTGVGVRQVNEGPASDGVASSILVRDLNYSALSPETLALLAGTEGPGGMIASEWWLVRPSSLDDPYSVARPDGAGDPQWLEGLMGLKPAELTGWPQLAGILGEGNLAAKVAALQANGVYLPEVVREHLKLKVGEPILFNGHPAVFAGTIDAVNLQRLRFLDGRSALPIDLQDANSAMQESGLSATPTANELVERDFVHLSPDQIAVASANLVRDLGGDLRIINIYPGPGVDPVRRGHDVAQMVGVPVWAKGTQGVQRMIFTNLTTLSGGFALFVPIVLGGLIIFGTLLGSISDREKEIYTFSALGLAPKHVGFLFFAEAAVYAVVGGMGGQLLAQIVAHVASLLARHNLIQAPNINYSSTNSLFAIGLVMATVLISAIYPALRASKSANPGLARSWRMPKPVNDEITMTFPFTVSAYDITGVVSFLAEHFKAHNDAGLGSFAASEVGIDREDKDGHLRLSVHLALAPFDLGVTQQLALTAKPSEIPGVDEVMIWVKRSSGTTGDWVRANRVFVQELRKQFLLWRTLAPDVIEQYRLETLRVLGELNRQSA